MEVDAGDDGRIRSGTLATATAHAFTAIIGAGILALPWSVAQLGWIVGCFVLISFAIITYYTAILLCDCYRAPDPVHGRRNYTYIGAVRTLLGPKNELLCGIMQYTLLWGTMVGYTVTTAVCVATVKRTICFHAYGQKANCGVSGNLYMLVFGAIQILLSQCPNLEKVAFLSVVATVTSFAYALIALGLCTAKVCMDHQLKGSLVVAVGNSKINEALSTKVWHSFQALGNIAVAYTFSMLLVEIQVLLVF
ncbi:hypothetical protein JCGZ_14854 [Jatropha curcas]|uniref:Amino acid transporter transmembrane domain-containing protein n=1 Tax=Jatropha curcas TaxID=180498 RepID=A0A067KIH2_JATCU|nr:hypothetical protein JCGZ_14854 [Jatropha curcas]